MGRGMAWFAGAGGFPYTLSRRPIGGRRGADNVVGGLCVAAPQGGSVLVSTLPLAGVTKKMVYGGAASVVSKGAGRRPGGADGFVVLRRGRGVLYVFPNHTWLAAGTPYPQPLGPLQGARGGGCGMAWFAGTGGFPCTLSRCPMGGRRGADNVVGGLFAAAPQGRSALVCALPLAGVTKKMGSGGVASNV